MTPKAKKERRVLWWKARLQTLRQWLFCVGGIAITLTLPGLRNGIAGITAYIPSPLEIGIALGLGLVAIVIDDELGGNKVDRPAVSRRKAKHAFIVGIGILSVIEKVLGG